MIACFQQLVCRRDVYFTRKVFFHQRENRFLKEFLDLSTEVFAILSRDLSGGRA